MGDVVELARRRKSIEEPVDGDDHFPMIELRLFLQDDDENDDDESLPRGFARGIGVVFVFFAGILLGALL